MSKQFQVGNIVELVNTEGLCWATKFKGSRATVIHENHTIPEIGNDEYIDVAWHDSVEGRDAVGAFFPHRFVLVEPSKKIETVDPMDLSHVQYERDMLIATHAILDQGFLPNVYRFACHESFWMHVYNILTYTNRDACDFKRRIEEQILTLTNKRTPPQHHDRLVTPDRHALQWCLNALHEKHPETFSKQIGESR